jgi:hypothetical protein
LKNPPKTNTKQVQTHTTNILSHIELSTEGEKDIPKCRERRGAVLDIAWQNQLPRWGGG